MTQKKILAQILGPKNVIPNAISIQAHQPDHIIFLRTLYPGQTVEEDSSHNRLFAWLQGGETLVLEYEDLNEPFPIRITPPKGFVGKEIGDIPSFEVINLQTNEIVDRLISLQDECDSTNLHFDLLPGAKGVKIPLLISTSHWKMWYSTEAGNSIHYAANFQMETHRGPHLSLIDRGWLGGTPLYVQRSFSSKPDEDTMEFHRHIIEALELDRPKGKRRISELYNRPKTIHENRFRRKLEEHGFTIETTIPKNSEEGTPSRDMTISKGPNHLSFHYLNLVGNKQGHFLEPLIEIQLWASEWNPLETTLAMEAYEHSAQERELKILRQLEHLKTYWIGVHKKSKEHYYLDKTDHSNAANFERLCNKVDLSPNTVTDVNELWKKISAYPEFASEELSKYTTICELDVLMLDNHGLALFDGKVVSHDGYKPDVFAAKKPHWLRQRREFVVHATSFPPKYFEKESRIIHFDRIQFGRDVIADSNRCYPLPCPMIERAKSYFFENGECSQSGIELVNELHFEYNRETSSLELNPDSRFIHIHNKDDYNFLSACRQLKHLYCPILEKWDLIDFSSFRPIEISYQNIGIRIGMINKKQYFFTPKRLDWNDIRLIRKDLQRLTNSDNSPSNWPEWTNKQKSWKLEKSKNPVRMVILNEEIDQTDLVVIDTKPEPTEPPEKKSRNRGRRNDATAPDNAQSEPDLICKTGGCNEPTKGKDEAHCSLECFRKHKKFSKFGHCLVESCNEPRTQNSQYCSPDCRQNHEDCNNSESIE